MTNIYKSIAEKASDYQEKLTAKEFFSRKEVQQYFTDSCFEIGNRHGYKLSVSTRFDFNEDGSVAYTNGKLITLFPLSKFFPTDSLEHHAVCVLGVSAHELAHMLFTDFVNLRKAVAGFQEGKIVYMPDDSDPDVKRNLKKIKEAIKDPHMAGVITRIYHEIHNILEDGYIEDHLLQLYKGEMSDALITVREHQFYSGTAVGEFSQKIASSKDYSRWAVATGFMLSYAKYGMFLCNKLSELNDPILDDTKKVMPIIDRYMECPLSDKETRLILPMEVIAKLWDILESEAEQAAKSSKELEQLLKEMKKAQKEAAGSESTPSPENVDGDLHSKNVGDDDDDEESSKKGSSARAQAAKKTKEMMEKGSGKESNGGESEDEGSDGKENGQSNDGDGENTEFDPEIRPDDKKHAARDSVSKDSKGGVKNVIAEEAGRIDNTTTEGEVRGENEGRTFHHDIEDSGYNAAAEDIKNLISTVCTNASIEQMEMDATHTMQKNAKNFKLGGMHEGVDFHVNRIANVDERLKSSYNEISEPLLAISKKMQKAMMKKLKEAKQGAKQTGLLYGRRLQTSALYRVDKRVFTNTKLPLEKSKLSVGILIDESGSMGGGNRATSARASAIILEDFCRGLDIPCCIYGHSEGFHSGTAVDMYCYVSFDNVDGNDRYRLMDISARGGNRDGAALAFIGEQMQKREEENRIIIIISDGQPAASRYYGEAAEEDLRNVKRALNRAGIPLFAAAIGDDKENIHRIYGDGFMDITNLDDMPKILVNLVSKFCKL